MVSVEGLDTFEKPFAGIKNVTFDEGVELGTGQVSHGEMVREGNDERMILDPKTSCSSTRESRTPTTAATTAGCLTGSGCLRAVIAE